MTKVELTEKLSKVNNVHVLLNEIQCAESDEAALEILKRHGLMFEANELKNMISSDELDANDLEFVAGGCSCSRFRRFIIGLLNAIFGTDVPCCQ